MSLWSDYLDHDGRQAVKWAHYLPIYERHFARWVNRPVTLLEIGVAGGGSLQLWKKYLGPLARIVGLDIDPACAGLTEPQIDVRIGDQKDGAMLDALLSEFGPPDIVIDDGSHMQADMIATFTHLYPRMDRNGVYLVEDLRASYWPQYGGGLRKEGSFIEYTKTLIDRLNARYTRGELAEDWFTQQTLSIHLYDCVAVFERGLVPVARRVLRGEGRADS